MDSTSDRNDQEAPAPDSGYYSPPHELDSDAREVSREVFTFDEASARSRSSTSTPRREPSPPAIFALDHTLGSVYGRRACKRRRSASHPLPRCSTPEPAMQRSHSAQESNQFDCDDDQGIDLSILDQTQEIGQTAASDPSTSLDASRPVAVVRPLSPEMVSVAVQVAMVDDLTVELLTERVGRRLRTLADNFDRRRFNILIEVLPGPALRLLQEGVVEGLIRTARFWFLF